MKSQIDKLTGESFTPKRSNQLFAKSENRVKYHNDRANALRKAKAYYDVPLNKNYKILKELLGDKKEITTHQEFLLGKGFIFHIYTKMLNNTMFQIYDVYYKNLTNQKVKIWK